MIQIYKLYIIGTLFLVTNIINAKSLGKTYYVWLSSQVKQYKGECYEIDKETNGEKYTYKVRKSLCRPIGTEYIWQQHPEKYRGKCFIIDKKTKGLEYADSASIGKCKPKEIFYHFQMNSNKKGDCIMVDKASGGQEFAIISSDKNCKKGEMALRFQIDKDHKSGNCYQFDTETQGQKFIKKVPRRDCKPQNTEYVYIKNLRSKSGQCYEIDAEKGSSAYISQTKVENCYDSQTQKKYFWINPGSDQKSGCYEVGKTNLNESYKKMTSSKFCKPTKIEYTFIKTRPLKGRCYEVDSATFGVNYKKSTSVKNCRPKEGKYITAMIKKKCYFIDEETRGKNYIENTNKKSCYSDEVTSNFLWTINKRNPWKGSCEKIISGKKYPARAKECRPKKTRFTWHNEKPFSGNCYMVDDLEGHYLYSEVVKRKKCKPIKTKYHYDRKKGQVSGVCYLVDSETLGKKYYRLEKGLLCQDSILQ